MALSDLTQRIAFGASQARQGRPPSGKTVTLAARSALYFIQHPDQLREMGGPDPRHDAQGFADWVNSYPYPQQLMALVDGAE